ncbi:MAG: type II toxin-antitoxin system PemK/MazF family toxin [Actinobacteria bacterium]|nr:type II toxin-antitoxin system PemK/MazF family toxin [Actinomycetota bacterium]
MATEPTLSRGDIWRVDFGAHPADREQALRRPALIVSDDQLHHPNLRLVIVVPGTSTIRQLPLHVVAEPDDNNGLDHTTAFQVEQVRAISTRRLGERMGRLDSATRHTVDEILRNVLNLP